MADNVRRIVAEFSARNKAKGVMAGFGRDLDVTGRALRRLAVGALAVAGVGGLGYMLKRQMETIDATAKLSDRLGVATEKLIGLQHAASITGTDAETLNKSLEIFTRRLGEMTQGSGEAKRGLDMLGLTAEQLIHISPAEAFGIAADKIKQLGTQAEKTAAAYFLFGRAGSKMLNMLEVGSEGLRGFQNEVEKLGLTFSRIDAAKVEAANDALTRARAVMTGLFRQATIQLSPYIEAAATAFVNLATAGEGVGANVVNAFESISLSIVSTAEEVERLIQKLAALASPVDYMKKMTKGTEEAWKRYRRETGETMAGKYTLGPLYAPVQPKDKELFDRILAEERAGVGLEVLSRESKIRALFESIRAKAAGQAIAGIGTAKEISLLGPAPESKERKSALEGVKRYAAALENEIEIAKRVAQGHLYAAKMIGLENELKKAGIEGTASAIATTEAYVKRLEMLQGLKDKMAADEKKRADARERELEKIRLEEQRWDDVARSMENSFANAFEAMAFEAQKFGDVMKVVARDILMEMMRIMMFRPAAQALADWLTPALSGLVGGIGGLFVGGGMPTVGTVTPETGATLAKYQHGGIATSPHLAMVGEVPEAFVPLSGGRSIPVEMRGNRVGGVTVNVNNDGMEKFEVSQAAEYWAGDQRIIDIFITRAQTDGGLRRAIKNAAK